MDNIRRSPIAFFVFLTGLLAFLAGLVMGILAIWNDPSRLSDHLGATAALIGVPGGFLAFGAAMVVWG